MVISCNHYFWDVVTPPALFRLLLGWNLNPDLKWKTGIKKIEDMSEEGICFLFSLFIPHFQWFSFNLSSFLYFLRLCFIFLLFLVLLLVLSLSSCFSPLLLYLILFILPNFSLFLFSLFSFFTFFSLLIFLSLSLLLSFSSLFFYSNLLSRLSIPMLFPPLFSSLCSFSPTFSIGKGLRAAPLFRPRHL